jgi:Putative Ig domain
MARVLFFKRARLRGPWVRALGGTVVCAVAAAAHATDDLRISGSPPQTVRVGTLYSFTPRVSDPSKKRLYFSVENKPKWASFSSTTGRLWGTPTAAEVGTQVNIRIAVTDSVVNAYLPFFHVTVEAAAADKPVISGSPATRVTAGSAYRFQPSARDPDGKALSFTVEHKPAWASFSIATGLLEGTPSSKQTGAYDDIVISASNGRYSSTLPAFNVTVTASTAASTAPATGTAKLTWKPPTANTNGSKLTDLAGVRIYYGTSESDLSHSVQVAGTTTTTYTISGLTAGTWYFGARAYTTAGTTSGLSSIVATTVE